MFKSESLQSHQSRAQSADSFKAVVLTFSACKLLIKWTSLSQIIFLLQKCKTYIY